jgi:hypothetical protein
LAGALIAFDYLETANGLAAASGEIWLMGPYDFGQIERPSIIDQGRLLHGHAVNEVTHMGNINRHIQNGPLAGTMRILTRARN